MRVALWRGADFKEMPWKNGGGKTLELFIERAGQDYDLRLSIATIEQPGPFSDFSGYDRIITQLEGAPLQLQFTDKKQVKQLEPLTPFAFAGEDKIHCHLEGRARDFNVMMKRQVYSATVATFHESGQIPAHQQVFAYGIAGQASVAGHVVAARELLRVFPEGKTLPIDLAGQFLLVFIDKK
jgi:environmental stress-induced protein Ves